MFRGPKAYSNSCGNRPVRPAKPINNLQASNFRRTSRRPFQSPFHADLSSVPESTRMPADERARASRRARLVHGVYRHTTASTTPAVSSLKNPCSASRDTPVMPCASRAVGALSAALPRERVCSFAHPPFLTLSKATTSSTVSSSSSSSAAPVRGSTVLSARGHRAAPAAPLRAQMPPGLTKKTDRSSSVCLHCCTSFSTYRRHFKPFSTSAEALPCAKWFHFVELVRHVVTQQFCVSLSTNPPRLVACSNRTAGSVADILT
jgi:hypothetical protein